MRWVFLKLSNVLKETEDSALQVDASGKLPCSPPGWGLPAWSVVHGLDRNVDEKLSFNEHTEKITMDPYNVEKGGSDGTFGMILEANERTLLETSPKTAYVWMTIELFLLGKQEINFSDEDAKVASTTQENSNEHNYHVTPRVEVKSESPMVIALTDQTLPCEDAPISKNLSCSSCDDRWQGDLNKLDCLGRWLNKEIDKDCDDSLMASDTDFLYGPLALSQQKQIDVDPLGYSLAWEQLFTILDFSPEWTYSGARTKVLICGMFLGSLKQQPSHVKWCCMSGKVEVPAEVLPYNALRCQAPVHPPRRVPFYITCSNRLACSEVREFEYREKAYANSMGCIAEPEEEMRLQIRLARMLHLTAEEKQQFACSAKNCEKCNLKKQIDFSGDADVEWGDIEKIFNVDREDKRNPKEELI